MRMTSFSLPSCTMISELPFLPLNYEKPFILTIGVNDLSNRARLVPGLLYKRVRVLEFGPSAVDPRLFTQNARNDVLLVQNYVDDIIFASTNTAMCNEFANLMTTKFKMLMMGQMSFLLGLQISQSHKGIFLNQSKYAYEIIQKYGLLTSDYVDTPTVEKNKLDEDVDPNRIDLEFLNLCKV
ncbi:retrovirus-related pol polyprotein from transposon TNT 1-94 [Tanacetum coccineum]|uniref:Retrovirus-related pol polyprotein from transposon TNT 1-94 n=1 Tax=Tanacetum coccineum TaxID=301880 RepID=A0ABQ5G3H8_9ASTR